MNKTSKVSCKTITYEIDLHQDNKLS